MDLAAYIDTLALFGDESRLRLCALLRERELSVTDLVRVTGISQPRVSTHLARLREAGVVRDRRDGQHAYYALATDGLSPTARALLDGAAVATDPLLDGDRRRLKELDASRRGGLLEHFAGAMERHYSPGRTWASLSAGLAALLRLGDVVDVGSGDGAVAAYLAPRCERLTCVDASERMIEAAASRLRKHGNVRALVADAHALPFREASFDAALLFHTLTYAERPEVVVAECARVLRPGGRLVILSLDRHEHRELTAPFGERHPGFTPRRLEGFVTRAGLALSSCELACREAKKPHLRVLLATAEKPASPRKSQ